MPDSVAVASEVKPDLIREALAPFLSANPLSAYRPSDGKTPATVERPWGDDSIEIRLRDAAGPLIEALNGSYLPSRLTAIWHRNTRRLEFIYRPLRGEDQLRLRTFTFQFNGTSYNCSFGDASEEVMLMARACRPVQPSSQTSYRNLREFQFLGRMRDATALDDNPKPTSFWIGEIDWDEEAVIRLAQHINIYMRYFDPDTPIVVIHDQPAEVVPARKLPLLMDNFPELIGARSLDPFLLKLWESTLRADPFRTFLHNYQILEYASFYYFRDEALNRIKRILMAPDVLTGVTERTKQILEMCVDTQMTDEQKLPQVVGKLANADSIWRAILPNLDFFASTIEFEGGMKIEPFIRPNWTLEDFRTSWIPAFPDKLRQIRNAMVHAREKRVARVILPTHANYDKLKPWLLPLQSTAMEVMIYWDAVFS